MSLVRWGLLGTARINRRLLPALRAVRRSTIIAVASRTHDRAAAFAREWDIPEAVGSYEELLTREDVDAIYVPLPNSLHVRWTLAAVAAGKHVLCEKPLALDPREVETIAAAAARAGVVVTEGFMYRHEPLTARVVSLLRDGAVGAVRTISAGFTFALNRTGDVRLDPTLGGGALADVGCYPVSYACLLIGRDAEAACGVARRAETGVDEEFTGLLRFSSDRTASIYASFRAAYRTWLEVTGSEGWLRVASPFKPGELERIEFEHLGEGHSVEVIGSPLLFVRQVEDFVAAVLDGATPAVSLAESRRVAAALASLRHAATGGPHERR